MTIIITACKNVECCGINYQATLPDFLVIADYLEHAKKQVTSTVKYHKAKTLTRQTAKNLILESVTKHHGNNVAASGVILSGFPILIMKFSGISNKCP